MPGIDRLTFTLRADPNDTIADLKERLCNAQGLPVHAQRLLYRDTELSDEFKSLADCGIRSGANLNLVLNLVSGNAPQLRTLPKPQTPSGLYLLFLKSDDDDIYLELRNGARAPLRHRINLSGVGALSQDGTRAAGRIDPLSGFGLELLHAAQMDSAGSTPRQLSAAGCGPGSGSGLHTEAETETDSPPTSAPGSADSSMSDGEDGAGLVRPLSGDSLASSLSASSTSLSSPPRSSPPSARSSHCAKLRCVPTSASTTTTSTSEEDCERPQSCTPSLRSPASSHFPSCSSSREDLPLHPSPLAQFRSLMTPLPPLPVSVSTGSGPQQRARRKTRPATSLCLKRVPGAQINIVVPDTRPASAEVSRGGRTGLPAAAVTAPHAHAPATRTHPPPHGADSNVSDATVDSALAALAERVAAAATDGRRVGAGAGMVGDDSGKSRCRATPPPSAMLVPRPGHPSPPSSASARVGRTTTSTPLSLASSSVGTDARTPSPLTPSSFGLPLDLDADLPLPLPALSQRHSYSPHTALAVADVVFLGPMEEPSSQGGAQTMVAAIRVKPAGKAVQMQHGRGRGVKGVGSAGSVGSVGSQGQRGTLRRTDKTGVSAARPASRGQHGGKPGSSCTTTPGRHATPAPAPPTPPPPTPPATHCVLCRARLRPAGSFPCKFCPRSTRFCAAHRLPERHACVGYKDGYKKEGRERLGKELVKVAGEKVGKV
ncbi:hypothetical protein M427DRAFT_166343 [Gonapodya prolifera JEL478]|uniref:Ubiquitin-like domain-containing protein n=1 Tax=Gonapodya prolifera (strain JEL478) TaxID=1344416 RepID=A0A139AZK3_GONPJ|nr:hypothetical protein M427DRAFT_166343 [Gonapodya prolifera JEL478]|eukprot:KXS22166.1 hypothetical protein M427DRAFT_166343 [Gonapodya prolifera JEL478]